MFVPPNFRPSEYQLESFFHPLFLYEMLAYLAIFFFLHKISFNKQNGKKVSDGTLFFSYLLLYNIVRFLIEFLRVDTTIWFSIRLNSAVSLGLILVSGLWLFCHLKKKPSLNEF
jgi:prolipoprotein diacylglyceryltransferase